MDELAPSFDDKVLGCVAVSPEDLTLLESTNDPDQIGTITTCYLKRLQYLLARCTTYMIARLNKPKATKPAMGFVIARATAI
jgi:hypothetical protein